jgi:uncharacterized delta-60 repeat protein
MEQVQGSICGGNMFAQFKRFAWKASLLAIVVSMLAFTIALAAPGDLDTTFSEDGKVTTDIGGGREDSIREIALQANGKIVVVGWRNDPVRANDFAVARYNPNGSLDTTFSGDGKLLTNFGAVDSAEDVAIQPDGKIVVGGMRCLEGIFPDLQCDVAIARYNANGALDTTFSGDGKVITDFGGGSNGFWGGLAIQTDGKIVMSGWIWNGTQSDFVVYRYNPNGALDPTFSRDGRARVNFGAGSVDWANDLALQANGKILVSGFACDNISFENCDFAVARLNTNGVLDTTFSIDGKQLINFGANDFSDSIAVQVDSRIILSGSKNSVSSDSFALARLNSNGSLDTSFSRDGKVVTSFGLGVGSGGSDVRVQSDGKIVAMGGADGDFALVRYNINGTLDMTFSTDGRVRVDFGSVDEGQKLVLQSKGRYVLAGSTQGDFALARVLP